MTDILQEGVRLPKSRCPYCDYRLDMASAFGGEPARPRPGDVTICIHCSQVLLFRFDLTLQKLAPGQLAAMVADNPRQRRQIEVMTAAVRQLDRRTNRADRRKLKRQMRKNS